MDTFVATPARTSVPATLRKLYLSRFAFAAVWAALLFPATGALTPWSSALLVAYPLFDVACAVIDVRSARADDGPVRHLYANIALSALTGAALAVAAASGIPAVLRVWGVWAVTAGLVQLLVGAARRRLGGQWAMIASGTVSVLAGASFYAQAGASGASLGSLAGYALLGGIFFLVSALRLGRAAKDA
ncbi:hypothetical protein ACF09I_19690 [Streptomyces sp. NPDC014940]|uniref:hypothetical protein n=1 Tax=Streptomyces sp. NPDC014940 TaxID=3364932 RepID=UPI0036F6FAF2